MECTLYDATGRLGPTLGFCNQESADINLEGKMYVAGSPDPCCNYILDGQITERPASPVTLFDLTLLAVPTGSTLWINGESYAAEGDVELEFPLPGTYRLRVECWPYRDWEGEVTAPVVSGVEP